MPELARHAGRAGDDPPADDYPAAQARAHDHRDGVMAGRLIAVPDMVRCTRAAALASLL